jgi:hypothetical protein
LVIVSPLVRLVFGAATGFVFRSPTRNGLSAVGVGGLWVPDMIGFRVGGVTGDLV